jgi:hypothetical protein
MKSLIRSSLLFTIAFALIGCSATSHHPYIRVGATRSEIHQGIENGKAGLNLHLGKVQRLGVGFPVRGSGTDGVKLPVESSKGQSAQSLIARIFPVFGSATTIEIPFGLRDFLASDTALSVILWIGWLPGYALTAVCEVWVLQPLSTSNASRMEGYFIGGTYHSDKTLGVLDQRKSMTG